MFEKIRSRLKFSAKKLNRDKNSKLESIEYGKIYSLWLIVLPLLLGIVFGKLACVCFGYGLDFLSGNAGIANTAVTTSFQGITAEDTEKGLEGFLAANPFHISPRKADVPIAKTVSADTKPEEPDTGLEDLVLRGTLPGVGAWVENKGSLSLLLVGKNIDRYKLTSVKYTEAVFRRGKKSITKYIVYGPVEAKKNTTPAKLPSQTINTPSPQPQGSIVAATTTGQEGQISSETVNQLVQNPFEELKRIRIRPNDKAGGLEVQWIQNDSILKNLGVQKGDVIRSINGIPFTNMGDIANSINSLMNSERFDVEVTRNGKPEALRYVVR